MMFGSPAYLRAIALSIQDAFPNSKVYVFSEESPFSPTKYSVKAYVDRYGACVTLDASEGVTESFISEKLISMIKDEMERGGNQ